MAEDDDALIRPVEAPRDPRASDPGDPPANVGASVVLLAPPSAPPLAGPSAPAPARAAAAIPLAADADLVSPPQPPAPETPSWARGLATIPAPDAQGALPGASPRVVVRPAAPRAPEPRGAGSRSESLADRAPRKESLWPHALFALCGVGLAVAVVAQTGGGPFAAPVAPTSAGSTAPATPVEPEPTEAMLAMASGVEAAVTAAGVELRRGRAALDEGLLEDALVAVNKAIAALEAVDEALAAAAGDPEVARSATWLAGVQRRRAGAGSRALLLRARALLGQDGADTLARAGEALEQARALVVPDDPEVRLVEGHHALVTGQLDRAAQAFGDVRRADPASLEALVGSIRVASLGGRAGDVVPLVNVALERLGAGPADDRALAALRVLLLCERARARLALDDLPAARKDAEEATRLPAGGWQAPACLAEVLVSAGERWAARDRWAEAVTKAGVAEPGALLARAEGLLEMGLPALALADARAAVLRAPGAPLPLVIVAEASEAALDLERASAEAEAVIGRADARSWRATSRAHLVVARVAARRGSARDAREHARMATDLDPASIEAALLRASIDLDPAFEEQYLDDAETTFKGVLRQRRGSLEAKRGAARVQLARNARMPERARRKVEECYEQDPRDPWTLAALAQITAHGDVERGRSLARAARRAERDPRRPAGAAFAQGVGALRRGQLERARDALLVAIDLDPLHGQALASLARLHLEQGDRDRAGTALRLALAAVPVTTLAQVLLARQATTREALRSLGRPGDAGVAPAVRAATAIGAAIERRGETRELALLRAYVGPLTISSEDDRRAALELATTRDRFDVLRAADPRSPWALEALRLERELTAELSRYETSEPVREQLSAREASLLDRERALEAELHALAPAAARTRAALQARGADELALATELSRLTPWDAEGWRALAAARSRAGDAWGALAAGVRAAHVDDVHAAGVVFALLRAAGSVAATGDAATLRDRVLAQDRDVPPVDADLDVLLRAAVTAARALGAKVTSDEGKPALEALEALIDADPARLLPHVLQGVLCHGADQREGALIALLFVGTADEAAGEAWYLAACTAAAESPDLAAEWLDRATAARFAWRDLGAREPRLDALRASALWARLAP